LRFQDPRTGLLVDEATRDGTIRRATRRSWLQTELAKAWIAQADRGVPGAYGKAVEALTVLRDSYLGQPFAEGWLDQRDGDGRAMPGPVSASTLYHIFVAIAEAERLSIPEVGAEAVASA
jgi:mannose-6-phosphate isomerase